MIKSVQKRPIHLYKKDPYFKKGNYYLRNNYKEHIRLRRALRAAPLILVLKIP